MGIYKEAVTAFDYCRRGASLLGHRLQTPFGEVDLLFQKSGPVPEKVVIEVKSVAEHAWSRAVVSFRQKKRLGRACLYLQERYSEPVEGLLALVDSRYKVSYIEDFLG